MPKAFEPSETQRRHVRVFVDEKKFVVDEVANKQNTLIIAFDPLEVPFKVMLVQDSAPAHEAKKVQDFLKENLPLMVPKDRYLAQQLPRSECL